MLLSVIMPVYNVESTVERAIKSVLSQTFTQLELILVNDGSTDRSGEICEEYSKKDNRVRIIHKENGGLSSARNKGLENVSGDYVAFIDSDDYLEKDIYQLFNDTLSKKEIDMYIYNVCRIRNGQEMILESKENFLESPEEIVKALFLYKGTDFYAWNKIYRKELFREVRYPEGKLYEDIVTSYELAKRSKTAIVTNKVGYYYIDNPASIVNSQFNPKQYDNVEQREQLLRKVTQEFPTLAPYAVDKMLDGFLSTGFKIGSSVRNKQTNYYLKQLRKDIVKVQKTIIKNSKSNTTKQLALLLLKANITAYTFLYRKVLRK